MRAVVTRDQVIEALREVMDPEIHLSIVELNMVKKVEIEGGTVKVLVALTVSGCPLMRTIEKDVKRILSSMPGVTRVEVETTSMSKEELDALRMMLQQRVMEQRKASRVTAPGIDRLEKKGIRNIVAIISGKGGVGKSFVTSYLAVELKRLGYEVGVLDADITGPSMAKMFGIKGPLRVTPERKILPATTKTGIKVVSMNLVLEEERMPVIVRGPIINGVIRQMFNDVDWGDLHFLLVDLPPGTSDAPLTVFQSLPLDGVIVVSTPQELAHMVVAKAINMAKILSEQLAPVRILGLVENMSYMRCSHCGERSEVFGPSRGADAAKKAGIPFLGTMPIDPKIASLCDQGRIEDYESPEFAEVTGAVRVNAAKLLGPVQEAIAWQKAAEERARES